jgi:hypothetical protein
MTNKNTYATRAEIAGSINYIGVGSSKSPSMGDVLKTMFLTTGRPTALEILKVVSK